MASHEQGTREIKTGLTENWSDETIIRDKYEARGNEFLQLLSDFEDTWGGHLGHINTVTNRIKLTFTRICLAYCDSNRVSPTATQRTAKKKPKFL